jgi:hypothetical protein
VRCRDDRVFTSPVVAWLAGRGPRRMSISPCRWLLAIAFGLMVFMPRISEMEER